MLKKIQWREPQGVQTSFLFAGDFCPREENSDYVAENAEKITANIKSVFDDADYRILQWETAVTEGGYPIVKDGPNLRCKASCLKFSKSLNCDIHLLANNHVGDFGSDAVIETIEHHKSANIMTVGAGKNLEDACKPLFFDTPSGRTAIINIAENEFGIPGLVTLIDMFGEWVGGLLENANPLLSSIIVDGIIGGVGAVVGFLPLVMVMYFLIALLEDCGYMARVTVVLDPQAKKHHGPGTMPQ